MNGHATEGDLALVRALEARASSGLAKSRELIELAILYWEPCHKEDEAILLLQGVLDREPKNSEAKLWLAYLYIYHRSVYEPTRAPLEDAVKGLREIICSDPGWAPAARIVLYEALDSLAPATNTTEKISVLENSVRERPDWVYNRYFLAVQYAKVRRYAEAVDQIRLAQQNVLSESPPLDRVARQFETSITGRLSHRIAERSLRPFEEKILRLSAGNGKV